MDLPSLGWDARLESLFLESRAAGRVHARVVEKHRRTYTVLTAEGEWAGQCRRSFLEGGGTVPALGDWVAARPLPGERKALIEAVLPRLTRFSRKQAGEETLEQVVVANVDVVFLVAALGREFNLRRLERALALAFASGARPVVLLN